MLRLHDTATGALSELGPRDPRRIGLYVCGPTVYELPHVGHGRSLLVYDVLRHYLESCGFEVHHVSNVTDIDDKIIDRANEEGRRPEDVVETYEAAWWEASDALGARRPHEAPHATAYIEAMVEMVGELVAGGFAYTAPEGVYLEVGRVPGYGLLVHQSLDSLRAGARVDVAEAKRSPADFALWKKAKPGEPEWPSPWGPGRPGWHTECVVMSLDLLGEGFDIHSGGMDLIFPHHENERAQAVALGRAFSRHWMHHAFVEVGGEKMSRSLRNFTTLTDLLERTDPRSYRMAVLQSHYRKPLDVTPESLSGASEAIARLDALQRRLPAAPVIELASGGLDEVAADRFRQRMDDDLDTPGAMAVVFDLVRQANSAFDAGAGADAARLAATVAAIVGSVGLAAEQRVVDAGAEQLMAERELARKARDFAAADALRDELARRGWVVEDRPDGPRLRRRAAG